MGLFNFSLKQWAGKAGIWLLAFMAVLSFVFAIISTPQTARAAGKLDNMSPESMAKAFVYYKALRTCLVQAGNDGWYENGTLYTISQSGASNYSWFYSGPGAFYEVNVGLIGDPRSTGNGQHRCYGDTEGKRFLKELVTLTGYTSGPEFLCAIGFNRQTTTSAERCPEIVSGVTNDFVAPDARKGNVIAEKLDKWWQDVMGATTLNAGGIGPGQYVLYYQSFTDSSNPCGIDTVRDGEEEYDYEIMAPSADGKSLKPTKYLIVDSGKNENSGVQLYDQLSRSCKDVAADLQSNSSAVSKFREWLRNNDDNVYTGTPPSQSGGEIDQGTSCSVDGIGWILCPVANLMAGLTDQLFDAVSAFMRVEPLNLSPNNNPLYSAWSVMRTIANIAFVIVFLIIIFSQLTGAGVSNYGVKKLLPRMVIGAILVNVSFFVCAIAVDIVNILGVAIQDVFQLIGSQAANTGQSGENWGSIVTSVLTGSVALVGTGLAIEALASGGVMGVLAGVLPLLVGALFALVVAFLILLARQALIIMLIVLSPLAFVAFLLPNTEGLFKKWRDMFVSLLVLFPLLSLVFGGSLLAGIVLRETSNTIMQAQGEGSLVAFFMYLGSFAVQAIPLFIAPLLVNLSSGVLNRFAGMVNNRNRGPFDRMRKGAERIAENAQNRRFTNKLRRGGALNFGARRRVEKDAVHTSLANEAKRAESSYIADKIKNDEKLQAAMAGSRNEEAMQRVLAGAIKTEDKLQAEDVEAGRAVIEELNLSGSMRQDLATKGAYTDKDGRVVTGSKTMQRAAISQQMVAGSMSEQHAIIEATKKGGALAEFAPLISRLSVQNGTASKDPALAGMQIDKIAQGDFDYDTAVVQAIKDGRYTAEAFASMHDKARERAIWVAQEAAANGNPKLLKTLQEAAAGVTESKELSGKISGNPEAAKQFDAVLKGKELPRPPVAVPSLRERAVDRAYEAATGSSGTTPFVVGSDGAIDQNSTRGRAEARAAQDATIPSSGGVFRVNSAGETNTPRPFTIDPNGAAPTPTNPYTSAEQTPPPQVDPANIPDYFGNNNDNNGQQSS